MENSRVVLLVLHDSERRARRVKLAKLEATANVPEVLVTTLKFFNVCGQVRVDHADIRVVEAEADGHGSLVSLPRTERTIREATLYAAT